jgi:RNA polymerase sigma-70 factor (ECF subfamily)
MAMRFEEVVLPHLDAAYNLARWLTRSENDADDLVQEAFMRALKYFDSFHGTDCRAWLLTIVRHVCYTWLRQNRAHEPIASLDEDAQEPAADSYDPQVIVGRNTTIQLVRNTLEELPVHFREVIVLHDLEGLSYKQIADVVGVPIGTVMSRLARARKQLHDCLTSRMSKES